MKFWDSSAIVPLCVDQPFSPALTGLAKKDTVLVCWWGSYVECQSAFARIRREGYFSRSDEESARQNLDDLSQSWIEISPTNEVRKKASRCLLLHRLRGADSLQLAAALVWAQGDPSPYTFVSLDKQLNLAARSEGFQILPEL